ncbi:hypothetical protein H7X87_03995, partial [Acetobacteraceae bacterium]|nr:hypothetical protein [Candidatus Parcubacteria bacterium]
YKEEGYLPHALVNFLAFLGWNPGDEREVMSVEEIIDAFSFQRVHKAGAKFDDIKLKWLNHEHIKKLSDQEFSLILNEYAKTPISPAIIPLLKERSQTLKEAVDAVATGEYDFLQSVSPDKELLLQSAKAEKEEVVQHLRKLLELLAPIGDEAFTMEKIKEVIFPYATEVGRSTVLWPMRTALSGKEKSPDPFTLAALLGKEETISRLKNALEMLK